MKIPDVHGQELEKATGTWMVLGTQSLIDSTPQGHDYLVAELKAWVPKLNLPRLARAHFHR